ncbi:efflux RND transporter periplasmic adaptor subunit [Bacteroides sp. CAG:633]|uniref:efflux RND transporter periplasmic adaptor subunit n=1 Tax=Bacteroides sp. CAG:633 TaxID=1262744 RepID=UPI00258F2243|nr:efflux RND transporter periplasmic adaptor subunit [Bacteroides sp. CAG:633]
MKTSIYFMLCCLPLLTACGEKKQEMPGEKYKTLTVTTTNQTLQSTYPATLRGRQAVEVRPQISGTITKICINEGDIVRRGQVLFIIDQVPYKAALETALANVKSAEAQLQTARLTADSKEQLFKEKVVSDFDRQTARNQLLEAEAALAQAKAEETNARNNLSYTEVKSPVDGVASMIPYRVGALVNSNITEPLVTVSDDAEIYAYFSMAENQMLDLIQQYGSLEEACQKMPAVSLTMSNEKTYQEAGRIDAISGTIDESTGGVTLRAIFKNDSHLLRNGGSGVISVPTEYKDCISIPQSATYELQNRVFTWKVVDGKTQSAPITVYKYNDGQTYIVLSGLAAGDVIIAEGAGLMREGTAVNTNNTPQTSEPAK